MPLSIIRLMPTRLVSSTLHRRLSHSQHLPGRVAIRALSSGNSVGGGGGGGGDDDKKNDNVVSSGDAVTTTATTTEATTTTTTTEASSSSAASASSSKSSMSQWTPDDINEEMALGVQEATRLFIRHGLARRRLEGLRRNDDGTGGSVAVGDEDDEEEARAEIPLVTKWQKMMETFMGMQVHVLAGLGYPPTEEGLTMYNSQLGQLLQSADPDVQEKLRTMGRDNWREVLSITFGIPYSPGGDDNDLAELSTVDARNIMHKVSLKMQGDDILHLVAKRCASIEPNADARAEVAQRHRIVQEILMEEVYMRGNPSLVEECGFGRGVEGYIRMQMSIAEHQSDPLITQYLGAAMTKVLTSAGMDMAALQRAAQAAQAAQSR